MSAASDLSSSILQRAMLDVVRVSHSVCERRERRVSCEAVGLHWQASGARRTERLGQPNYSLRRTCVSASRDLRMPALVLLPFTCFNLVSPRSYFRHLMKPWSRGNNSRRSERWSNCTPTSSHTDSNLNHRETSQILSLPVLCLFSLPLRRLHGRAGNGQVCARQARCGSSPYPGAGRAWRRFRAG